MLLGVPVPFALFELSAYILLCLCVWHTGRSGALRRARLIELGIGVLYGLTLEVLTILQFHAYQYGHFLIMLGPVPVAIAVGWGIILYSTMTFADSIAIPIWAAPALVGLLGLNIAFPYGCNSYPLAYVAMVWCGIRPAMVWCSLRQLLCLVYCAVFVVDLTLAGTPVDIASRMAQATGGTGCAPRLCHYPHTS
jgi:hypothetical protein